MRTSKIFTNRELQEIEFFKQGNRKDKQGVFCSKVKPKIIELQKIWLPKIKELNALLKK